MDYANKVVAITGGARGIRIGNGPGVSYSRCTNRTGGSGLGQRLRLKPSVAWE